MQLNKCHHPVKVSIKIALTNKNFYFVIVYEINFRTCELFHKIEVSTYKRLEKKIVYLITMVYNICCVHKMYPAELSSYLVINTSPIKILTRNFMISYLSFVHLFIIEHFSDTFSLLRAPPFL